MKRVLAFAFALPLAVLSGAASAATLDFVAEAAGNERAVADGTHLTIGGLGITFSAGAGGVDSDFAYFDDLSGGRPAGLGVCTALSGTQCNPSSDDNISADEFVSLTFDDMLSDMRGFRFFDADHYLLSASSDLLDVMIENTVTGDSIGGAYSFSFLSSNSFLEAGLDFNFNKVTFGYHNRQYYIGALTTTAAVPLPASAPLLLGGLTLIAGMARRRRKAA